jgi:hypothetical protein
MIDIVERLRGKKERVEIPCPDNIKGCAVLHFRLEVNPDCAEAADEIERLRKALQLIAAPSKVVVKGEEAVVALRLVLSSHRRTALKALSEKE